MKIQLNIERLVLHGLPIRHDQGSIVKAAVEAELTRLLAENGVGPGFLSGVAVASLRANDVRLSQDSHPVDLGHRIARAVYGGIAE